MNIKKERQHSALQSISVMLLTCGLDQGLADPVMKLILAEADKKANTAEEEAAAMERQLQKTDDNFGNLEMVVRLRLCPLVTSLEKLGLSAHPIWQEADKFLQTELPDTVA